MTAKESKFYCCACFWLSDTLGNFMYVVHNLKHCFFFCVLNN